jgi:hypothetical protein
MAGAAAFLIAFSVAVSSRAAETKPGPEPAAPASASELAPGALIPAAASTKPKLGEKLEFHGRWMGIPVGYGWIEVKEMTEVNGRNAYHIEAHGKSNKFLSRFYPIHDEIHSYLDAETLKPLRFEKHQREGGYRSDEVVEFNYATGKAHYKSLLNGSEKDVEIPKDELQDLVSALYWFRAQPLKLDETVTVALYTDEKIYNTDILVTGPQNLELLKRGTFRTMVVEPKATFKGLLVKRGRIWAYLTADSHRMPLLVKATTPWGQMSAVLDDKAIPEGVERVEDAPVGSVMAAE